MLDPQVVAALAPLRDDPALFVRTVLSAEPTPQQEALLRAAAAPGARLAVRSGHGTGKTTALAWLALWFVSLRENCRVPCTAPTSHQLHDVLWPEISRWKERMAPWFRDRLEVTGERLVARGAERTQFAVARTARPENPEALQGFHAEHLLFLVDEASGVDDRIFEAAEGALSTPSARVVMAGNPTQISGYFHRAFHSGRSLWTRLTLSCLDSPLVDPGYPRTMAARYGEDSDIYRVRVLGEFPRAGLAGLMSPDAVQAAASRSLTERDCRHAPVVFGLDVARYGEDASVLILRQGLFCRVLGTWRGLDLMRLADLTARFEAEHRPWAVFIDAGAMGPGVIDRLRQLGRRPVEVHFGGRALREDRYANRRAEMWAGVRDWLAAGGALPPDCPELAQDLAGPQYAFDPAGRLVLERKEDMKRRGLASPDHGDALALTFAQDADLPGPFRQDRADSDFNLFGGA